MNTTVFKLLKKSLYVFLINWKKCVGDIKYIKRKESNMKKAISKTINRSLFL